jgi:hypothetical protein
MRFGANLGMVLLAVWLILTGLLPFLKYGVPYSATILPLLALVAGVLLLAGRKT